ncbi:hypoxanthine phosphoribosyltransferase 1 [Perkinsus olseni]|uniref:hypoxanthine phosphoribosyltransferase n=1 Tax=Perkinsus olseni TaxID=32597 RepID=A0A7J6LLG6_PEROL|nr:hypoxanthine phosphoribosyltransferase 1 [Perkinsus olseni]
MYNLAGASFGQQAATNDGTAWREVKAASDATGGRGVVEEALDRMAAHLKDSEANLRQLLIEKNELREMVRRAKEDQLRRSQQQQGGVVARPSGGPHQFHPPPFMWRPSAEYSSEFEVSGPQGEQVMKRGDYPEMGWVIPVGGSLSLCPGGLYQWSLEIVAKCPHRPQVQFGVHGEGHGKPWRLITTSRSSLSSDDEPWQDRPAGDRLIREGDLISVMVDLRGINGNPGALLYAVNDGPYEVAFSNLPMDPGVRMMPVVSMGGGVMSHSTDATEQDAALSPKGGYSYDYVGKGVGRKEPIFVKDSDEEMYHLEHFLIPPHYKNDLKKIMLPKGLILDRTEKLAMDIRRSYGDTKLHLLCILKGSRGFFSELVGYLNRIHRYTANMHHAPYQEHYVRIKSYHNTQSTGKLNVMADDLSVLKDQDVLIVEDIVDTGNTLSKFCKHLETFGPRSIRVATLVEKRTDKSCGFKGDFVGFSVPDDFIVGFCLDYNEHFRDLEHVAVLTDEAIRKYAK